jgi:Mg-chelatase subunit ChlD
MDAETTDHASTAKWGGSTWRVGVARPFKRRLPVRQGLTEIVLVLDRSGSMSSTKSDAEGGLREFIQKQRVLPGECNLTFYRFDDTIERVFEAKPLKDVEERELKLDPRGSTALLDAMARAIDEVGTRLSRHADYDRPEHVYVVIVTDGQENASLHTTKDVFAKVTTQRDQFKWEFLFIGANQDSIAAAAKIGISAQYSMNYSASKVGTQNTYNALNNTISRARGGELMCWSAEDRDAAVKSE